MRLNPRVIGNAAYIALRGLAATLRIKIIKHPNIDSKQVYLFAFWHGQQFLPSIVVRKQHKTALCAMVSPSRDGAILSTYLKQLGYDVIRGSSRDRNVAALINMKNKLLAGSSVGFGIDGPIGPIGVIKPGIAYLAQKCNVAIIPVGTAFSRKWIFEKAWDKFALPKPFAKAVMVFGEPLVVTADQDQEAVCLELKQRVDAAEAQAAITL